MKIPIIISLLISLVHSFHRVNGNRKYFEGNFKTNEFNISSKSLLGKTVSYSFSIKGGVPCFFIKYSTQNVKKNDTQVLFALRLEGLVELISSPKDTNITLKNSLRSMWFSKMAAIDKAKWSKVIYSKTTINGSYIYSANISLKFKNHPIYMNTSIICEISFSDSFVQIDKQNYVDSDGLKYSITLQNWNYKRKNSQLIMVKSIWELNNDISQERQLWNETVEKKAIFVNRELGFFEWNPFVIADNKTVPLISTNLYESDDLDDNLSNFSKTSALLIAYYFPRANIIYWDPYIGLNGNELRLDSSSSRNFFGFILFIHASLYFAIF